jgi:hypothetical protein
MQRHGVGPRWSLSAGKCRAFGAVVAVALQLANHGFDLVGWPAVDWGAYLQAARDDPFGAGLTVTGMLATTLLPTLLHLLAAGVALLPPSIGGGGIAGLAAKKKTTLLDRVIFVASVAGSAVASWLILALVCIVLWHGLGSFAGPLGGHLADLAVEAGRWVGGPGAP